MKKQFMKRQTGFRLMGNGKEKSGGETMQKSEFLWGSATASYQCEGAWNLDGKGVGEWDVF